MINVGQKFAEARLEKKLTLKDVAESTKIKEAFLKAIEEDDFEKLPSIAYAQGFVRNYARFLELPEKETLALFRRGYDAEKIQKVLPQGFTKTKEFPLSRLRFRQTLFLFIPLFLIFIGYILFQYRGAFISPSLYISSPKDNSVISATSVSVIGKTESSATVFVNNFLVSVDQNGVFSKEISVFAGKSVITVKVINKFGKETTLKRNVEIKPGS